MVDQGPWRVFVSGVGTEVGKTFVGRALAAAFRAEGHTVAALKPVETGCVDGPADAIALAAAAGTAELANIAGFYRAEPPLGPMSVSVAHGKQAPSVDTLANLITHVQGFYALTLVEGAGGLLVPLTARQTLADLVGALRYPVVLVARDALGVQSHVLAMMEAARGRGIRVLAVVLSATNPAERDPSADTNRAVLQACLPQVPVLCVPWLRDDLKVMAEWARDIGLVDIIKRGAATPVGRSSSAPRDASLAHPR